MRLATWISTALLLLSVAFAASLPASGSSEPPALEVVDRYGPSLVAYAVVERDDGTYRRMLVAPEVIRAIKSGAPLPDGTHILMETYYSPGQVSTVFHSRKVGGQWHYGSFGANSPNLDVGPRASCLSCHAQAAERDFTFTLPSLQAAAAGLGASRLSCDRGGRRPCAAEAYQVP
ncbi:MAG: cytochrome P460 family protein [Pseudomonadota bacterium]